MKIANKNAGFSLFETTLIVFCLAALALGWIFIATRWFSKNDFNQSFLERQRQYLSSVRSEQAQKSANYLTHGTHACRRRAEVIWFNGGHGGILAPDRVLTRVKAREVFNGCYNQELNKLELSLRPDVLQELKKGLL